MKLVEIDSSKTVNEQIAIRTEPPLTAEVLKRFNARNVNRNLVSLREEDGCLMLSKGQQEVLTGNGFPFSLREFLERELTRAETAELEEKQKIEAARKVYLDSLSEAFGVPHN